jgi:hypothetical protein
MTKTILHLITLVAIIPVMVGGWILTINAFSAAGKNFWDYAMSSDFGIFVTVWDYSPILTLVFILSSFLIVVLNVFFQSHTRR